MITKIWREIARAMEMRTLGQRLGGILAEEYPISALAVQSIDVGHKIISTVTSWQEEGTSGVVDASIQTATAESKITRVLDWYQSGRIKHFSRSSRLVGAEQFLTGCRDCDVLVIILADDQQILGLVTIVSRTMFSFSEEDVTELGRLMEPVVIALQNNRYVQRMMIDREAAESERLSLLRKLGRDQLDQAIVGMESGLKPVMERVEYVSRSDVAVLIFGETGSGKEVIARAIHDRSSRSSGPFLRVNCGAIPSELIDSELFGHERGSFSGAINLRKGWFERGDGGTLFLDEVAELPQAAQVRLLRVLQDGSFQRVGGQQELHADVRIIAATHRDLQKMVAEQSFREDLWYRLSVFPIDLPALRERPEDIAALAEHFARRSARRFGLAYQAPNLADINMLMVYPWPGNIRELAAVIDRAAILGNGKKLEIEKALGIFRQPSRTFAREIADENRTGNDRIQSLDDMIVNHIIAILKYTRGRIEGPLGAAALLKTNPQTLRSKMKKLHIIAKDFRKFP